ncbi:hypothetical protein CSW98_08200 [Vibrio sp. HA2012]|uniref:YbgA family protein n=1 Tax=Vibrio sp. HA2012 TaxID=1971595 RepID=UPI000C2CC189|nr:DUF523 and DUF1722 domain-containing protein [Vibrio sp. HA2012]PJC86957.1 hypothetical protein CSW98_08200 [Vibrio sp. HA2012]
MCSSKILVGVSACVVGERVRFDSGHKRDQFVADELSNYFLFMPLCPEIGIGLPVPRPAIRLVSDKERVALVENKNQTKDYTMAMQKYAKQKINTLRRDDLCGYIVCAKSPTCGMEKVKVYKNDYADKKGIGVFTRELMENMPWLPVEEAGRLNDPHLRENFISRVYCLRDFYDSIGNDSDVRTCQSGKIIAFHSRYKLTLMAHSPQLYEKLGRMVASVNEYDPQQFFYDYRLGLMQAMSQPVSRNNTTNVLMHIQGYFKRRLSCQEKQELVQVIQDYRLGFRPLMAPLTLLEHYLSHYPNRYLQQQNFFDPYPHTLRLRYSL